MRRVLGPLVGMTLAGLAACSDDSPELDFAAMNGKDGGNVVVVPSDGGSSTSDSSVKDSAVVDAKLPPSDAGTDANKPLPTPLAGLVKCMNEKPYVESSCTATTVSGWNHPALACTYPSPIGTLSVTVADASAEQVAVWIMDAGDSIPAIAHLKTSDPTSYLRALQSIASALMIQSGRIFPIEGKVGEDQGDGYIGYHFTKGVSDCQTGEPHCYCRINSLSRGDYCDYRAFEGKETVAACRNRVGYGGGATTAWRDECLGNHSVSWGQAMNEHIRAQVWVRIRDSGVTATSNGSSVINALDNGYGITSSTVNSFCN